jgi:hypothetical protein
MSGTWFRGYGVWITVAAVAAILVSCDGDGPASTPEASRTASESGTPVPSATPSLEEEISQAYLDYWDAYRAALLELDASLVERVATGEQLERIRQEIEGFRAQGVALRVVVEHNLVIAEASPTEATVVDEIVNNSFFVDPVTKEPSTAEGSGEVLNDTYHLEKTDGLWIVTNGSRRR